ncbi:dual specificity phosphatase CDC14A [Pelomyxa schiedti]|nr:dual specificity phosphatase CDC14A [Pelomyxa schiedti]
MSGSKPPRSTHTSASHSSGVVSSTSGTTPVKATPSHKPVAAPTPPTPTTPPSRRSAASPSSAGKSPGSPLSAAARSPTHVGESGAQHVHSLPDQSLITTVIQNKLYLVSTLTSTAKLPPRCSSCPCGCSSVEYFSIDNLLVYEPFFRDFGPLNLGHLYSYCMLLKDKMKEGHSHGKVFYHCTTPDGTNRANSAYLLGSYLIIMQGFTPEKAYEPFQGLKPALPPFRDASDLECTYKLKLLDVLKSVYKAMKLKILDFKTFDLKRYKHFELVENGDLNWIVPGKLLAFSGPVSSITPASSNIYTPDDYVSLFKSFGITTIVRLNKKVYDQKRFTDCGFSHYDLFFPDGTTPTRTIMHKFLEIVEEEPGAIAVHCKAGLGRTGTLICCSLIKHYHFTAAEAISWVRICRPGSVIGPQQHFLQEVQELLLKEAEAKEKHSSKSTSGHSTNIPPKSTSSKASSGTRKPETKTKPVPTHNYNLRNLSAVPKGSSLQQKKMLNQQQGPWQLHLASAVRQRSKSAAGNSLAPPVSTTTSAARTQALQELSTAMTALSVESDCEKTPATPTNRKDKLGAPSSTTTPSTLGTPTPSSKSKTRRRSASAVTPTKDSTPPKKTSPPTNSSTTPKNPSTHPKPSSPAPSKATPPHPKQASALKSATPLKSKQNLTPHIHEKTTSTTHKPTTGATTTTPVKPPVAKGAAAPSPISTTNKVPPPNTPSTPVSPNPKSTTNKPTKLTTTSNSTATATATTTVTTAKAPHKPHHRATTTPTPTSKTTNKSS